MEGRALRASARPEFRRRRGAPPSIAPTVIPTAVRPNDRESDDVASADAALPFASAFDAVRQ
jgi:hypothetical protein